jgi:hypothetical protein
MLPAAGSRRRRATQQRQERTAVVAWDCGECTAQADDDVEFPNVAAEKLQAAVRREALWDELDMQITLDPPAQAPYIAPFDAWERPSDSFR